MRRAIAAVALVLLFAPEAWAQRAGPQARTAPIGPEIAAQASFDTGYVLALYMAQLAATGTPPSQADIDEAARLYFTNGAAVVGVPSSGPGAAYFRNGAQVMAYPAPQAAPSVAVAAGKGAFGNEPSSEDAGAQGTAVGAEEVAPPGASATGPARSSAEAGSGASAAAGSTCTPLELEAAMALASQFATAAAPATPVPACMPAPPSTSVPPRTALAPVFVAEAAPSCPAGPSLFARIAPALGGVLFGGLAVALWSRPRSFRPTHPRRAR
jgi:hypothetical protein